MSETHMTLHLIRLNFNLVLNFTAFLKFIIQEQIERDMQNKSNNIVMQNLLMRLSRTCKPWWIPLEKYLLEEGDNKLYSFLSEFLGILYQIFNQSQ